MAKTFSEEIMKTLNDILTKLKFDKQSSLIEAHQQVLDLFAVEWLEQRIKAGQHETIVISDSLKEKIFSDELNQRITATVNDDDYPNNGSVIAGLVQEEIFNYLKKNNGQTMNHSEIPNT